MLINFQTAKLVELESKTGIPQEMWCRWFRGKNSVSLKSLDKAAKSLGVNKAVLLEQIEARASANKKKVDKSINQD